MNADNRNTFFTYNKEKSEIRVSFPKSLATTNAGECKYYEDGKDILGYAESDGNVYLTAAKEALEEMLILVENAMK